MKRSIYLLLALCLLQTPAMAGESRQSPGFWDILPEIIIRPMGVVASAAGVAFFVAGSPFTALASITEPHDAFSHTFDAFVKTLYRLTFRCPLGDYSLEIGEAQAGDAMASLD